MLEATYRYYDCPVCHGDNFTVIDEERNDMRFVAIRCMECETRGPMVRYRSGSTTSCFFTALDMWNCWVKGINQQLIEDSKEDG